MIGTLEEVHMPQNGINHAGIAALAKAFSRNPALRTINLNDNSFTKRGALSMAEVCEPTGLLNLLIYLFVGSRGVLHCNYLLPFYASADEVA